VPYIHQSDRTFFDEKISFKNNAIQTPGELNYFLTRIVDHYISTHGKSYSTINEAIGVLECAKLELYRRIASPYEDSKIKENGDVYTV
jgi:broad-specificity NMP kinase